jgi:hypothetical protein
MTRNKQVSTVLYVLLFVDGLLALSGSFTMLASAVQLPLWGGICFALYRENPESFHKPVSRKVVFWSIFGILAALTALVVLGMTVR